MPIILLKKEIGIVKSNQVVEIIADDKKIQRVLLNLISNAVKYTPDEGQVFIETSVSGKNSYIQRLSSF